MYDVQYNSRGSRSKSFLCPAPLTKAHLSFWICPGLPFPMQGLHAHVAGLQAWIWIQVMPPCPISKGFQGANAMLFLKYYVLRMHIWQPGEIRQIERSLVLLCIQYDIVHPIKTHQSSMTQELVYSLAFGAANVGVRRSLISPAASFK